jgi:cytochrome P450
VDWGIFLHPDQVVPLDLSRNLLLYKDPPEHTKYRAILQAAFTPHTVAKLADDVRARVTKVIAMIIEAGECDFVTVGQHAHVAPGPLHPGHARLSFP